LKTRIQIYGKHGTIGLAIATWLLNPVGLAIATRLRLGQHPPVNQDSYFHALAKVAFATAEHSLGG